ncbi:polysaccharide biosynthesis protein, partial [Streptomyces sp. SID12501]
MSLLSGASILVTGGTGSFGKAFLREVLEHHDPRRLVVFSRDELKQYEVRRELDDDPRLRWFIGDVRDRQRLTRAMHGVDYGVHAAALKQAEIESGALTGFTAAIAAYGFFFIPAM